MESASFYGYKLLDKVTCGKAPHPKLGFAVWCDLYVGTSVCTFAPRFAPLLPSENKKKAE